MTTKKKTKNIKKPADPMWGQTLRHAQRNGLYLLARETRYEFISKTTGQWIMTWWPKMHNYSGVENIKGTAHTGSQAIDGFLAQRNASAFTSAM